MGWWENTELRDLSVNPGFTTSQLWKPQQVTFLLGILFLLYRTASKDLP